MPVISFTREELISLQNVMQEQCFQGTLTQKINKAYKEMKTLPLTIQDYNKLFLTNLSSRLGYHTVNHFLNAQYKRHKKFNKLSVYWLKQFNFKMHPVTIKKYLKYYGVI